MSLDFWQERWKELNTPWDMQGVHSHHQRLIEQAVRLKLLPEGAAILEPGCGRAHAGADLSTKGYYVTSCDYVPEAIAEAKRLYGKTPRLTLQVADMLDLSQPIRARKPEAENQKFQAIYDRAMLCALQPDQRSVYIRKCFDSLQDKGIFMGILFAEVREIEQGPPFALPMEQLLELMQPYFSLAWAADFTDGMHDSVIAKETVCIWLKNQNADVGNN